MLHVRWWVLAIGAAALIASIWAVGDQAGRDADDQLGKAIREMYTNVCLVGNINKGLHRTNVRKGMEAGIGAPDNIARNDKLAVILNCQRTFEQNGKAVPLTHAQEEAFLDCMEGKLPANDEPGIPVMAEDGGSVVGCREPEQGDLADF